MTRFPRIGMKQMGQQVGMTAAAFSVKGPEKSSGSHDGILLVFFFPVVMTPLPSLYSDADRVFDRA